MEEKLSSQKHSYQEKKSQLKLKGLSYKKQAQSFEKSFNEMTSKYENSQKKFEIEKNEILQKNKNFELEITEQKSSHMISMVYFLYKIHAISIFRTNYQGNTKKN